MRIVSTGILLQTAILATQANDVRFHSNYSLCTNQSILQVKWAQRHYDPIQHIYSMAILALPSQNITDVNSDNTFFSTAKTEIQYGLQKSASHLDKFCIDVAEGCPVMRGNWTLLQKSLQLVPTQLPLGDITTRYSAWTGDQEPIICLAFSTVGHQDPFWRDIFRYFSVAVAGFAALSTLIVSYAILPVDEFDEFQWLISSSSVALASQLRLPGLYQVVYYTQFIVLTGQLTVSYPKFYRLFTSDFAWSFLLIPTSWIKNVIQQFFPQNIRDNGFPTYSVPSQSLNKREDFNYHETNVSGTGMALFANTIDLDINGIFYTCLVYFIMLLCICTAFVILLFIINFLLHCIYPFRRRRNTRKTMNLAIGIFLQCTTLCYLPLIVTSLYQLMLPAPWFFLLSAAILIVFPLFLFYGWIFFILLRLGEVAPLLRQSTTFTRIGSLYNHFAEGHALFFVFSTIDMIVKGVMVGLVQSNGTAQIIVLILSETIYYCLLLIRRPYVTRAINRFYTCIGSFRLLHLILTIVYLDRLSISETAKQYVAYVQVCIHMVVYVMFLFFAVKHVLVVLTGTADDIFYDPTMPPVRMSRWWWRPYNNRRSFQPVDTLPPATPLRPPPPRLPVHRELPRYSQRPETERLLDDPNLLNLK